MSRRGTQTRVGLLVLGALMVMMAGLFLIGEQNRLFAKKNRYFVTVGEVGGLSEGNPVRLNGVTVGLVESIDLPQDPREKLVTLRISIERRYEARIRQDSQAKIRTLGLLGDKFIDVTSGSPESPVLPPGGTIPTAAATDVDKLLASGGDVVDNMVRISYSLTRILDRIDRGEGVIGQLTTAESETITARFDATLATAERIMRDLEQGKGALGRVMRDDQLGERLASAVDDLHGVLSEARRGDGLVATAINDPKTREDFQATLAQARATATQLSNWTAQVEKNEGLVGRLLTDKGMGDRVGGDLESLVHNLSEVSQKLNKGDGAVSKFINDPQIYDAVNDIIVGIDESRMLRWLIRNRQKSGIEKRYEGAGGPQPVPEAPVEPTATPPAQR